MHSPLRKTKDRQGCFEKEEGILASCKYRNRKLDISELDLMREYSDAMNQIKKRHFWFFLKDGFSPSFSASASDDNKVFSLEDLYK
ncbi:MAG TPA: hypothetical protein IAB12_04465 [Candidatus Ornithospirochaeta avicola]|uniref:Uncharacterized protein n=1 Tax=Candidatus Ornithospirochaeta avicola TaxID=2840896 RepID=A0A9D1PUT4_9SPIO|nr:hypothetical protein [Candidatus Ornithospirochaeta avicola]